ncbi:hypothetical protein INT45_012987 [Circinella minor]|uniref:HTH CENPB-type domain-containing protein n=1 Tax=Circinella minor TaxID=1195481 RepID=A0A8H7VH78_9FUNG|nr:hypothetical protein INT45_012987 [Circinella minor]
MSLSPMSSTLNKPKTTLPQTSLTLSPSQPTSSKSPPPTKTHQKQPTLNPHDEVTLPSANSKNITTKMTATIPPQLTERIKQARPGSTTSISPTTHEPPNKKLRHVMDSNPASMNNICVTNTTKATNFFQFPTAQPKFNYVHIPCQQCTTRQETCKLLRRLNINTSRILDISFPGKKSALTNRQKLAICLRKQREKITPSELARLAKDEFKLDKLPGQQTIKPALLELKLLLAQYVTDMGNASQPISMASIIHQAKIQCRRRQLEVPEDFQFSNGWLTKFMR